MHVDEETVWFLQGRDNCNRAVNGDIVAAELLPKDEWTSPQKLIKVNFTIYVVLLILR